MREVARYLIEMGHLKRVPRTGWSRITREKVESVAEHSHRTSLIGFVLACLEGANPDRVSSLCSFHDVEETRLGDIPPLTRKYLGNTEEAETSCLGDQLRPLPDSLRSALLDLHEDYRGKKTLESRVAHDADRLDCALQALELIAQGRNQALEFFEKSVSELLTSAGQGLGAFLVSELRSGRLSSLVAWWKDPEPKAPPS